MRIEPLSLAGACLVHDQPNLDSRGAFSRIYCSRELGEALGDGAIVQASVSRTHRARTLRGMHFQWPPVAEDKLIRCIRGRVFDVILDLRPRSPTFSQHVGVPLAQGDGLAVLVPKGFAHGFMTLEDDCELLYMMTAFHSQESSGGVRWNDPAFGIEWPAEPLSMSDRDAGYQDFDPDGFRREYTDREGRGVR